MEQHRKANKLCITMILMYQKWVSPHLHKRCRFEPTCSQYALDAYRTHGCIKATKLVLFRLLRCHPFARGGVDPL
ncbi:MAG: membrane protein insertion efficiency factor YidD [Pseudomonadota bacterium]|nr:membrane protein insertion efficiency factor YidD [Pseudomonadota bacterium]MEC8461174.1 membrane protein insertion efficiency factor YidD [Pseudomonadota bacterium]